MLVRIITGLAVTAAGTALVARRATFLFRLVATGKPAPGRMADLRRQVWAEVTDVFGQRKLLKRPLPGLAHFFTFWGFVVLLLTIIEAYGDLFDRNFAIPGIGRRPALGLVEDVFATAVLVALVAFSAIRLREAPERRQRQSRFFGSHTAAAWAVLLLIFLVIATLLMYRGAQIDTGHFPYGQSWWPFASHLVGLALSGFGTRVDGRIETAFVLGQIAVIWGFFVLVVHSKHLHIFVAEPNVLFSRRPQALGALASTPDLDVEAMDESTVVGVGRAEDLSWKQRLDLLSCTECGRCQDSCPAWATAKPLSPKLLIMDLRDELLRRGRSLLGGTAAPSSGVTPGAAQGELVPAVIEPDVLWSCTTCGACVEQCPVDIEHVDTIVDIRRYEVLMRSRFPSEATTFLRNIETRGDPWGLGRSHRMEWTEGVGFDVPVADGSLPEGTEYLLWVGCAGALDERARRVTQSVARLLRRGGVSFAVLGPGESCTGDPARRFGNEYLFQTQARQNIETLDAAGVKRVVTWCPHCFNTLAREYPALGGNYEVMHYSSLLAELVSGGALSPASDSPPAAGAPSRPGLTVTYHDPCYLARHNDVRDEPRSVLTAMAGLTQIEMHRCGRRTFCCGAGGARMWMEESIGTRINSERTDEALGTGADVIGVACPYCMIMLDDALKQRQADGKAGEHVRVMDLAQLVESSLPGPPDQLAPR